MHISIAVPKSDLVLSSVVGPFKLFHAANQILEQKGEPPLFEIDLVGHPVKLYGGLFEIPLVKAYSEVGTTNLLILPAFTERPEQAIESNSDLISFIQEKRSEGSEVASLCMGAFYLAATGLLNGKPATTHWMGAEAFKAMFPEVKLQAENIITQSNGMFCSGGAYSFLNLILYLIETYTDRGLAIQLSKVFEIEFSRPSQSPFIVFSRQKHHKDETVLQAQTQIEERYSQPISVETLANDLAVSRRNFIRRFKQAVGNTPIEYIQRVRIEAAKKELESGNKSIVEIMEKVGYSDGKAFRKVFRKHTGTSPSVYRNMFERMPVLATLG